MKVRITPGIILERVTSNKISKTTVYPREPRVPQRLPRPHLPRWQLFTRPLACSLFSCHIARRSCTRLIATAFAFQMIAIKT